MNVTKSYASKAKSLIFSSGFFITAAVVALVANGVAVNARLQPHAYYVLTHTVWFL